MGTITPTSWGGMNIKGAISMQGQNAWHKVVSQEVIAVIVTMVTVCAVIIIEYSVCVTLFKA